MGLFDRSIEDNLTDATKAGLLEAGMDEDQAETIAPWLAIAPQFIPLVGAGVGVDNTVRAAKAGNYGEAAFEGAMTLLGEIPGVGDVAGKAIRGGADRLGIFAGRGSREAIQEGADLAEEMQKKAGPYDESRKLSEAQRSATDELTKRQQQWFVGADGKPRYEISDKYTQLKGRLGSDTGHASLEYGTKADGLGSESGQFYNLGTLGDVLEHHDLYRAYPHLKNIPVRGGDLGGAKAAYGSSMTGGPEDGLMFVNTARLGGDVEGVKSAILHEAQHGVQEFEGFARGSSPELSQADLQEWKELAYSSEDYADYGIREMSFDDLKGASQAERVTSYREMAKRSGAGQAPRPGQITKQSDWYKHSDKIRSDLGPMPKNPGAARDEWQEKAWGMLADLEYEDTLLNGSTREASRMEGLLGAGMDKKQLAKEIKANQKEINAANPGWMNYKRYLQKDKNFKGRDDISLYGYSAGEAEARAVQRRMNMSSGERRLGPVADDYTIPTHLKQRYRDNNPHKEEVVPFESLLTVFD